MELVYYVKITNKSDKIILQATALEFVYFENLVSTFTSHISEHHLYSNYHKFILTP